MKKKKLDSKGREQKSASGNIEDKLRDKRLAVADFFVGEVVEVKGVKFVVVNTFHKQQILQLKVEQ